MEWIILNPDKEYKVGMSIQIWVYPKPKRLKRRAYTIVITRIVFKKSMMNLIKVDETKHQVTITDFIKFYNLTVVKISDRKTHNITRDNFQMYYRTYKEGVEQNDPLHPRPIVEEYNFAKVS